MKMNIKTRLKLLSLAIAACNTEPLAYATRNSYHLQRGTYNPAYRVKEKRILRKYIVKGIEVEAYSRQDAIKRLNHSKGGKRK